MASEMKQEIKAKGTGTWCLQLLMAVLKGSAEV